MPGPVSVTATSTDPSCGEADTVTRPPAGVNRRALSSRLNKNWCTRPGSATPRAEGAEGNTLPTQRNVAGFQARELEQLFHQTGEALGLGQHHLERLRIGFLDAAPAVRP